MKQTQRHLVLAILFALAAGTLFPCTGAEFLLTKNGKSACVIVTPEKGSLITDHAARELSTFLGKISNGEKPSVVKGKIPANQYPIIFHIDPKASTSGEGYIISVDKKGVKLTSRHPRGILYAVFKLLKETTGIRWVFPGKDGEYFKIQPTIKVKSGIRKEEPSFAYRGLSLHCMGITSLAKDTRDWMVRNGLQLHIMPFLLSKKYKILTRLMQERGVYIKDNLGFTNVFTGLSQWEGDKLMAEWFKTDKEIFPLINGKRVCMKLHGYQPCTSNPETIRRSVEGLIKYAVKPMGRKEGVIDIYNNDGTGWCQCENCRKLDSSYDKKMGYVSDRFWKYFVSVGQKVLEKYPYIKLNGIAYQNFEAPPSFQIDKRFGATLSFNRLCYRHKVDDPECLTNRKFFNFYKNWQKQGIFLVGREEMSGAGVDFQPVGPIYVHLLKFYKKMGLAGNFIAIAPPDGNYNANDKRSPKQWRGMWQAIYLHAIYTWNIHADYEKEWEEMNRLFYGKGWEGGMREFYKLLWETASNTPGCYGHAYSAPLGRCLDKPLAQEKLNKYLASALKAAAKDPDPRALAHVKFDAEHFKNTWEFQRKHYLQNYRELRAYEKTAPIKIDGILDEKDWKNADVITNLKSSQNIAKIAEQQTYARVVYEPEYFYFSAEMAEPEIGKVHTEITKRDGPTWGDNGLELFLTHPDLGGTFFHFIFNTNGVYFDRKVTADGKADNSFNCNVEVKTRRLKDRWVLEAKIPTAELGEKCFTGQSWKMNIMRVRKLTNRYGEGSTLTGGQPFDTGSFLSVAFAGKRFSTIGREGDSRKWANGSFNEPAAGKVNQAKRLNVENNVLPSSWGFLHLKGKENSLIAWRKFPESSNNYYIHLKNSAMLNALLAKGENFRVNFRYRGKGHFTFYVLRYKKKGGGLPSKIIRTQKPDTKEWTNARFDFKKVGDPDNERQFFGIWVHGEADFDEVYVTPLNQ